MKTLKLILVVCALLALTTQLNAQVSQATLTKNGAVLINAEEPLQSVYMLDASQFNFASDQQAIEYFAQKNSPHVSYRPVLHNNAVMVYLQLKTNPNWTKADWNAYFAENKIKGNMAETQQHLTK